MKSGMLAADALYPVLTKNGEAGTIAGRFLSLFAYLHRFGILGQSITIIFEWWVLHRPGWIKCLDKQAFRQKFPVFPLNVFLLSCLYSLFSIFVCGIHAGAGEELMETPEANLGVEVKEYETGMFLYCYCCSQSLHTALKSEVVLFRFLRHHHYPILLSLTSIQQPCTRRGWRMSSSRCATRTLRSTCLEASPRVSFAAAVFFALSVCFIC